MKKIFAFFLILCSVLFFCGFSEADYALYVYFEDGDLYMRNNHAAIITNDPGVYFHADIRTLDYDYITSSENIKLEVGETALIMTEEELRGISGDLPGILVHGNSNVLIVDEEFTNNIYYYFEEIPADPDADENFADTGMPLSLLGIIGISAAAIAVALMCMWLGARARRRRA